MNNEGTKRRFILDTGSNVSLIQPAVKTAEVMTTNLSPFGVTGDELEIKGQQEVVFSVQNVNYQHRFLVCSLSTKAAGILGMDFFFSI